MGYAESQYTIDEINSSIKTNINSSMGTEGSRPLNDIVTRYESEKYGFLKRNDIDLWFEQRIINEKVSSGSVILVTKDFLYVSYNNYVKRIDINNDRSVATDVHTPVDQKELSHIIGDYILLISNSKIKVVKINIISAQGSLISEISVGGMYSCYDAEHVYITSVSEYSNKIQKYTFPNLEFVAETPAYSTVSYIDSYNDFLFIRSGTNFIRKISKDTMTEVGNINISNIRDIHIAQNKIYVSRYSPFKINIYDADTLSLIKTLDPESIFLPGSEFKQMLWLKDLNLFALIWTTQRTIIFTDENLNIYTHIKIIDNVVFSLPYITDGKNLFTIYKDDTSSHQISMIEPRVRETYKVDGGE